MYYQLIIAINEDLVRRNLTDTFVEHTYDHRETELKTVSDIFLSGLRCQKQPKKPNRVNFTHIGDCGFIP